MYEFNNISIWRSMRSGKYAFRHHELKHLEVGDVLENWMLELEGTKENGREIPCVYRRVEITSVYKLNTHPFDYAYEVMGEPRKGHISKGELIKIIKILFGG